LSAADLLTDKRSSTAGERLRHLSGQLDSANDLFTAVKRASRRGQAIKGLGRSLEGAMQTFNRVGKRAGRLPPRDAVAGTRILHALKNKDERMEKELMRLGYSMHAIELLRRELAEIEEEQLGSNEEREEETMRLTKRDGEQVGDVGLGDPLPDQQEDEIQTRQEEEEEDEEEEDEDEEDDEEVVWSDYAAWGLDKRGLGSVV